MSLGQARALLHDILADRYHGPWCDCAACLYAAYRRSKKAKGRTYSKKLFFMFDLWVSFFWDIILDRKYWHEHKRKGLYRSFKVLWDFKGIPKPGWSEFGKPVEIGSWIYDDDKARWIKDSVKDVVQIVRNRTHSMIKKLMKIERTREGKLFLSSYLKKKNFYIYYRRAQDLAFRKLAGKLRAEILAPVRNACN